jgi:16S rRNA (uracil1498-N3)-methyltransferase
MSRRRFYVPPESIQDGVAALPLDQAHHLRNVLRMGSGDVVEIFDGKGLGYIGSVELHGTEVLVRILRPAKTSVSRNQVILAAALIKSAKFEWILQKTTELGVGEIIPLQTRFSEIQIADGKIGSRMERWNRIVQEASRQCGRSAAPALHSPSDFSNFLENESLQNAERFLCYEKASDLLRLDKYPEASRIILCLGPEGGWDPGEVEQARNSGYRIFSLGPWTLRAETAAVAAVSIVQHQLHLWHL